MSALTPFHLAIPCRDVAEATAFYRDVLGCSLGRASEDWIDLNLFGHQLVCHLDPNLGPDGQVKLVHSDVDKHAVPIPHFGVVLSMDDWQQLAERLTDYGVKFMIEPYVRFKGQAGEQATLFFKDPSGNALEFKAFKDLNRLFAID
ncbi:glyoxalase [Marinicella pacifica]|uniref:Glyoxalase n=1 Tax=Marinicella pacifica TaxID=1171543 RepID=A0A917FU41_9GAMM|nr:VOC family protein [Marinicella pacifica]GGG01690.1 glyoxalase [Marinicella pacifica]